MPTWKQVSALLGVWFLVVLVPVLWLTSAAGRQSVTEPANTLLRILLSFLACVISVLIKLSGQKGSQ
jgi:hypothetical protein